MSILVRLVAVCTNTQLVFLMFNQTKNFLLSKIYFISIQQKCNFNQKIMISKQSFNYLFGWNYFFFKLKLLFCLIKHKKYYLNKSLGLLGLHVQGSQFGFV